MELGATDENLLNFQANYSDNSYIEDEQEKEKKEEENK